MPPNIEILADDVTIHGFTIASPTVIATEATGGIILIGADIEIYDCGFVVATGISSVAIQTYHEAVVEGDISGLHIHDCTFTNGTVIGEGQYEGIYINPQFDTVDTANPVIIENDTFDGTLTRAVGCERSYTVIRGNDISTTAGAPTTDVSSSAIHAVTWDGTTAVTNVSILNNTITGDGSTGWERGLRIGYGDQPMDAIVITGNDITGCVTYGIIVDVALAADDDIVINNNSIAGNADGLANVGTAGAFSVDATSNWWGDAAGPDDGVATTTGDTVSTPLTEIDYSSWLTTAP